MHCTNCGAEVPAGAKFCGNCGQATGGAAIAQPEKVSAKKDLRDTKKLSGCIGVVAIVGLIYAIAQCSGGTGDGDNVSVVAKPTMNVTAAALWKAYQDNEASAQQRFDNHVLVVDGAVAGVDLDITNNPVVLLRTPNEFMSVHAKLDEPSKAKAGSLSKGQSVTLTCQSVSEVIGTPMLDDCAI